MNTRILRITIDGKMWEEPAGARTALELQHELRNAGRSVRVVERYIKVVDKKEVR